MTAIDNAGTTSSVRPVRVSSAYAGKAIYWAGVLLLPVLWQIYAWIADSPLIPGPLEIVIPAVELIQSGELGKAVLESGVVLVGGVGLGVLIGGGLGLLMGRFRIVDAVLDSYVSAFYATPKIALIPILVVVLGWGTVAKIAIVAMVALTPICFNTAVGLRSIPIDIHELAKSFCSTEYRKWVDIYIPCALPSILPGLYIGIGRALTAVVVAEFSTKVTGLGNLIQTYATVLDMPRSLVPVVLLILVGYVLYLLFKFVERRVLHWVIR